MLTVHTSPARSIRFVIPEYIIQQIPHYATKLQTARTQSVAGGRLQITDPMFRNEEAMMSIMDFLATGFLKPLDVSTPRAALKAFSDLVDIHSLGVVLQIEQIEEKILKMIDEVLA